MKNERLELLASQISLEGITILTGANRSTKLLEQIVLSCKAGTNIEPSMSEIASDEEVEQYLQDADALLNANRALEAELLLIGVTILSSHRSSAIAKLAALYESQSRYIHTIAFTQEILGRRGQNTEAAYQLAFALYKTERHDEALEYILPYYICDPSQRITRLCGLLLKSLGRAGDAIDVLTSAIDSDPADLFSLHALSEIYDALGMRQKSLDILNKLPDQTGDSKTLLHKAIIYRHKGELECSIRFLSKAIAEKPSFVDALWVQCFNYSIGGIKYAQDLLTASRRHWTASGYLDLNTITPSPRTHSAANKPIRLGFLTSDIGDHVVSRFLTPLLRSYDQQRFFIALLSTARRFEASATTITSMVDLAVPLQDLSLSEVRTCLQELNLDIILDTNGFTSNSGLAILGQRCAPIQGHYIGYHATTGLRTIDYFLGDSITTPSEMQWQYTEKLVQIPQLWMAYDPEVEFPAATSKSTRDSPVFGAFSQVTKINSLTLEYWSAALLAAPDSILAIKDKGVLCDATRKRIEDTIEQYGVDPDRVYFFGPVGSQLDHLDSYNAIDIALDTTPWSGATTAFEALGMGVPLVAICGDTTSGRMSTSVVSAAGKSHWIAHSKEDFARIAAELAEDYQNLRESKASMQKEIRSGILFDEQRICRDVYATIERLVTDPALADKEKSEMLKGEANSAP